MDTLLQTTHPKGILAHYSDEEGTHDLLAFGESNKIYVFERSNSNFKPQNIIDLPQTYIITTLTWIHSDLLYATAAPASAPTATLFPVQLTATVPAPEFALNFLPVESALIYDTLYLSDSHHLYALAVPPVRPADLRRCPPPEHVLASDTQMHIMPSAHGLVIADGAQLRLLPPAAAAPCDPPLVLPAPATAAATTATAAAAVTPSHAVLVHVGHASLAAAGGVAVGPGPWCMAGRGGGWVLAGAREGAIVLEQVTRPERRWEVSAVATVALPVPVETLSTVLVHNNHLVAVAQVRDGPNLVIDITLNDFADFTYSIFTPTPSTPPLARARPHPRHITCAGSLALLVDDLGCVSAATSVTGELLGGQCDVQPSIFTLQPASAPASAQYTVTEHPLAPLTGPAPAAPPRPRLHLPSPPTSLSVGGGAHAWAGALYEDTVLVGWYDDAGTLQQKAVPAPAGAAGAAGATVALSWPRTAAQSGAESVTVTVITATTCTSFSIDTRGTIYDRFIAPLPAPAPRPRRTFSRPRLWPGSLAKIGPRRYTLHDSTLTIDTLPRTPPPPPFTPARGPALVHAGRAAGCPPAVLGAVIAAELMHSTVSTYLTLVSNPADGEALCAGAWVPASHLVTVLAGWGAAAVARTRDPLDAALFYALCGRHDALAGAFKHVEPRISGFLEKGFDTEKQRVSASKNAYGLLARGRVRPAAGFFVFAGDLGAAQNILTKDNDEFALVLLSRAQEAGLITCTPRIPLPPCPFLRWAVAATAGASTPPPPAPSLAAAPYVLTVLEAAAEAGRARGLRPGEREQTQAQAVQACVKAGSVQAALALAGGKAEPEKTVAPTVAGFGGLDADFLADVGLDFLDLGAFGIGAPAAAPAAPAPPAKMTPALLFAHAAALAADPTHTLPAGAPASLHTLATAIQTRMPDLPPESLYVLAAAAPAHFPAARAALAHAIHAPAPAAAPSALLAAARAAAAGPPLARACAAEYLISKCTDSDDTLQHDLLAHGVASLHAAVASLTVPTTAAAAGLAVTAGGGDGLATLRHWAEMEGVTGEEVAAVRPYVDYMPCQAVKTAALAAAAAAAAAAKPGHTHVAAPVAPPLPPFTLPAGHTRVVLTAGLALAATTRPLPGLHVATTAAPEPVVPGVHLHAMRAAPAPGRGLTDFRDVFGLSARPGGGVAAVSSGSGDVCLVSHGGRVLHLRYGPGPRYRHLLWDATGGRLCCVASAGTVTLFRVSSGADAATAVVEARFGRDHALAGGFLTPVLVALVMRRGGLAVISAVPWIAGRRASRVLHPLPVTFTAAVVACRTYATVGATGAGAGAGGWVVGSDSGSVAAVSFVIHESGDVDTANLPVPPALAASGSFVAGASFPGCEAVVVVTTGGTWVWRKTVCRKIGETGEAVTLFYDAHVRMMHVGVVAGTTLVRIEIEEDSLC